MQLRTFLRPFGAGLLAGVVLWEGPRAWLVWRAEARRAADAAMPHGGTGLERTAAGLTDATRLMAGEAAVLLLVLLAVAGLLVAAYLAPDSPRRTRLARWAAAGMGLMVGAVGALYGRIFF